MIGILRRLKLILKAWLHSLLAPPDDPRTVFVAVHQRQQGLLDTVRRAQQDVAASRERLVAKASTVRQRLPALERQARDALKGEREDLARFALQLRQVAAEELGSLEAQSQELERQGQVLTLAEHRLTTQIDSFFARQEVMAARYSTAEAHVQISEALGGVSEELAGLGEALERAEQTSDDMEARVAAIDQLVETGILELPGYSPTQGAQQPPGDQSTLLPIEDHLAALKQELEAG